MMKKLIPFLVLFCVFHFYEMKAQQATCNADIINVTTDVQNGQIDNQHAGTVLTATNMIENGGEATYKAGTDITLSPGFHAKEGSEFTGLIEACSLAETLFITEWDFTSGTITIPTVGGDYNYDIDWENDGIWDVFGATGTETYTATPTNILEVAIRGGFPRISFGLASSISNDLKLLDIKQWGNIVWDDMFRAFEGCENMNISASDAPDLTSIGISMAHMFQGCRNFDSDINHWDVINVINMHDMFWTASDFNKPLNSWDVDNVKDMGGMFGYAIKFNQDLSSWDVDNVEDMSSMFRYAQDYNNNNQILSWDQKVGNVEDMRFMFNQANSFNQEINNWDVGKVTDMSYMFSGAYLFNKNLNDWNVVNVTDMSHMFTTASNFDGNITGWNVVNVTDMSYMFSTALAFNQDISSWVVTSVTNMEGMFLGTDNFDVDINAWDVSNVTNMSAMFQSTEKFDRDLNSWDVMNVTDMSKMFFLSESFNGNITSWDVDNVTNMSEMFYFASKFNQDLGGWDVRNVTDMSLMFSSSLLGQLNYESTLNGWANLDNLTPGLSQGVSLGAHNRQYCDSTGRDILTNSSGPNWTITGDLDLCARPLSTEDVAISGFNMYPNPVQDKLFLAGLSGLPNYDVQISDITGRLVLIKENKKEIDVSGLRPGVYFLQILGEKKVTKKFIKM